MKKLWFIVSILFCLVVLFGCKSKPAAVESIDDAFARVYNKYRGNLILDGAETYTVVSGDTLSKISREQYGNGFFYPIIMLASSDIVLDPDKIAPGMDLTVPVLEANFADKKAVDTIKAYLVDIAKIEENRGRQEVADGMRDLSNELTITE